MKKTFLHSGNKATREKQHIGKIIREKVYKSGLSVTEFAEKIHLSRPAVYQLFKKDFIDSDLLIRISLLLKENLVKYIYEEVETALKEKKTNISTEEITTCNESENRVVFKLEQIHVELTAIKIILSDIRTV